MTIRLDDKLGAVCTTAKGKQEALFPVTGVPVEKVRRYAVYVDGKLRFKSKNLCGERVLILLLEGVNPARIRIKDSETGNIYEPKIG